MWLITDMRRGESLFEIGPTLQEKVDSGIETEGSNLSGVNSKCQWEEPGDNDRDSLYNKETFDDDEDEERGHISIIGGEMLNLPFTSLQNFNLSQSESICRQQNKWYLTLYQTTKIWI